MTAKHRTKASVHLLAYNSAGQLVLEEELPFQQYRERWHPLLDEPAFRKVRAIVRLSGVVTDSHGQNSEEFEILFDPSGLCSREATRLADGTILGDRELLRP